MSFSEWREVKFVDICTKIGSGATPTGGANSYKTSGISLIRSQNVLDFSFTTDGLAFIDDIQAEKLKGVTVEKGDILLNITGDSVARSCVVPDNVLPARVNQHVAIIRVDENIASNRFVFYYTQHIKSFLLSLAGNGGTRNALTKAMIEQLDILLPPLPEQKAIVKTLCTIDNAIELNDQINKSLEGMARAIFKSWFVDFEPFKEGELEESELGLIPKGWRVGTISELISETLGGDWGKDAPHGNYTEKVMCIRGADIPEIAKGKSGKPPTRYIIKKNLEKKWLSENEIIIEISGGSPSQSTGRTALITKELVSAIKDPMICTNFCRAIILKKAEYSSYVFSLLQHLYHADIFFLYENGTTGIKNLDITNLFGQYQVVIPSEEVISEYHKLFLTLVKSIYGNGFECNKLSEIRDSLIPKLISGEVRVPIEQ